MLFCVCIVLKTVNSKRTIQNNLNTRAFLTQVYSTSSRRTICNHAVSAVILKVNKHFQKEQNLTENSF